MSANDCLDDTKKLGTPPEPEAPALEAYLTEEMATEKPRPKRRRGFACIDPEKHREASRRGGLAAQASGKAHRFDSAEGKIAGRKGGLAAHQKSKVANEEEGASS